MSSGQEGKAGACGGGRVANEPQASAFGLVPTPTSDPTIQVIERFASRYKRLRKSVITSAKLLLESKQRDGFRFFLAMLTLTYAPGNEWHARHISDLQKKIRRYLGKHGKSYDFVWVCELQERGAPHYHILILVPHGVRLPMPDVMGWWPHGSTRIEKVEKAIGYLIKYVSKGQDTIHKFVRGQRTHGSGGLCKAAQMERRWWMAPQYVREHWPEMKSDVRRAPGGGWMSRETGEFMPSPWQFLGYVKDVGAVLRWIAGPKVGVFSSGVANER